MKISARNQFAGTISNINEGAVNGVVTIDLGHNTIKADITMDAIHELGLAEGKPATAIVKASNVMFAGADEQLTISARNVFKGEVVKCEKGAVNGRVTLKCGCGITISGTITNEAIEELGLAEGVTAKAFVKSTDVMVAVEA